ncbi:MAG TPA: FkbM family methyltransferase [Stellaceae bacterium]|nr:FkbM family methyltransferase [Stellaceae bacterium]
MSSTDGSADISFSVVVPTIYGQMIVNRHDINQTNALFKTGKAIDHAEINQLCRILHNCGPDPVVIDVGANFGTYSLGLAAVVGRNGKVHAFEAQRIIFNMLAGSVALNSLTNVYCYNMAVGDREGAIEIPQFDYTKTLNFGSIEFGPEQVEGLSQPRGHDPDRVEFVPLTTIDRFSFARVDLIKIDAEGMEIQVLEGAKETIQRCQPLLHAEFIKSDRVALRQKIADWGYDVYPNRGNYFCVPMRLKQKIKVAGAS